MNKVVKPEELQSVLRSVYKKYGNEKDLELREITQKVARETVKNLKATSPKRTGNYARGWTHSKKQTEHGITETVYNRVYQLTHLLNNDRKLRNGRTKEGDNHITNAEQIYISKFIEEVKTKL